MTRLNIERIGNNMYQTLGTRLSILKINNMYYAKDTSWRWTIRQLLEKYDIKEVKG